MKVITEQKPLEEIKALLEGRRKLFLVGCGNCATMCRTGGREEVVKMKGALEREGKEVTGWVVIPTPCDELTGEALKQEKARVEEADALLVMACAYGVQMVNSFVGKPVLPALNTVFLGLPLEREQEGLFSEACSQCGQCVLGETAGICPLTSCPKELLNGPCGGSKEGKCEVDPEKECAWIQIYERLKAQGREGLMAKYQPPRDFKKSVKPRRFTVRFEGEGEG